jgi:hypothetical protein
MRDHAHQIGAADLENASRIYSEVFPGDLGAFGGVARPARPTRPPARPTRPTRPTRPAHPKSAPLPMYAIVLIAILAVMLVFGIILWWRWSRKKPARVVADNPDLVATALTFDENTMRMQIDKETEEWISNADKTPLAEKVYLGNRSGVDMALFRCIIKFPQWQPYKLMKDFIPELYKMEACAMRYMTDKPLGPDLSRCLNIMANLVNMVDKDNAWALVRVSDEIKIIEREVGHAWGAADDLHKAGFIARAKTSICRLESILNALVRHQILDKHRLMRSEDLLYNDYALRRMFGGIEAPILTFINMNKSDINPDNDAKNPFIRLMSAAESGEITGKEPIKTLVQFALSRYFARITL